MGEQFQKSVAFLGGCILVGVFLKQPLRGKSVDLAFQLGIVEVGIVHYAGFGFLLFTEKQDFSDDIQFSSSRPFSDVPFPVMLEQSKLKFLRIKFSCSL